MLANRVTAFFAAPGAHFQTPLVIVLISPSRTTNGRSCEAQCGRWGRCLQRLGCSQRGGHAAGGAAIHHPIRGAAGLKLAAQFSIALFSVFLFGRGGQGQSSPVNNVMGTGWSKEACG